MGNDIPGEKKMVIGLTQIKGIGYNFATAILDTLKINTNSNIGNLSDSDVQAIEKLITDPQGGVFTGGRGLCRVVRSQTIGCGV